MTAILRLQLDDKDPVRVNSAINQLAEYVDRGGVGGTGTVTSIATGVGLTGGPITTTGTISIIRGQVPGTATNDNAAAGNVGEFVESDLPLASMISLTTDVEVNITSISLTAGDWDVCGVVYFDPTATTITQYVVSSLSTTSATGDLTHGRFGLFSYPPGSNVQSLMASPISPKRFSLSATTTIFLVGWSHFSTSTMTAYGNLSARRMR